MTQKSPQEAEDSSDQAQDEPEPVEILDTPDPTLELLDEEPAPISEPRVLESVRAAPKVNHPDDDEDNDDVGGPMFDMDKVRDKIEKSRASNREQEEKLVQSHLESKARQIMADRGDLPASQGVNPAEFLDDLHDGKVRNFDDIFARFPIGDDEFEIYVERKHPRRYRNTLIAGIQRPIQQRMNHKEFAEIYGSGSYLLTVYGPTPSGRLDDHGRPKRRPFTKPVKVDIPDPYNDNPPNPEMAVVATPDIEDDDMLSRGNGRRIMGGATDADAHIREVELRHQESSEERRLRMQEEQRDREDRKREEDRQRETDLASRILDSKDQELDMLRQEIREMRNAPSREETQISGVAQLLAAVRPEASTSEVNRLTQDLSDERRRNSDEMNRMRDMHQNELNRVIREKDDLIRVERERADARIREANELSRQRELDLRANLDRRIDDERRQHDRDLNSLRESQSMMHASGENSFKVQLEVRQTEVNRLAQDVARLQIELDAERRRTIAERVNEFAGAAEALGFSKDEGGGDRNWKDMLADAALGFVQHAPNLVSALRGGTPMQSMLPRQSQMMLPPSGGVQGYAPQHAFATEDSNVDFSGQGGPPIYPGQDPLAGIVDLHGREVPHSVQPTMVPQPSGAPGPGDDEEDEEEEEPSEGGIQLEDSQILEFSGMFREALSKGASPEEFSQGIVQQLGAMSGSIVRDLPLSRVIRVLEKAPTGDSDPLVRREGKQFLTKVWQIVEQMTE